MTAAEKEARIRNIIGETVGHASMCWDPKPLGVYDSEEASRCIDMAMERILKVLAAPMDRKSALDEIVSKLEHAMGALQEIQKDLDKPPGDKRWATIKPYMWRVANLDADDQGDFQRDLEEIFDKAFALGVASK